MIDTLFLQTTFLALLGTIAHILCDVLQPKGLPCAHEACWYAAKAHQGRLKWETLQQLLIELQANNISTLRMQPANPWQLHLPINHSAGGQLHAYYVCKAWADFTHIHVEQRVALFETLYLQIG